MKELLARGQERYNIYCTPCHSRIGDGNGIVAQRGLKHPPSFHEARLKQQPLAYFYDVDTNGFGAMLNYKEQIPTADRWAIAAYIRALQFSQDAKMADVPESERGSLQVTPEHAGTSMEPPTNQQHEQPGGPR
jgi:mono/diheme cytochrome c family protein